ncbi:nucleoside diphosphate-linked moiety X motif 17-like [Portunus trituberculatus]|uniref:nucleoside diphosphate-linked moiety X motif 17-like n=1 Tax=Portunus trituberculatus TaxID=210409 RepID=UPI001E1CE45C|nr:nucleoside diphosphate-linked moiety X motif 17-like [Portunus trituberculatus]XP_045120878.1 nucleoside diphosphate-linked moiety X motif 17-like [Portunus trituberculatus]XP_045120879.1 nucleoside diphosphate-linked moiety X motif 17-like [Portunus trituberculatus]XP_045120880.1 nucleoside diphosphate-linked moiety X motif 17-like [Portunus trituberculatus]XP_045120881.1 nucleoside diphosphate-linked moiety X motif 17-like [Portunus trituberculatus]
MTSASYSRVLVHLRRATQGVYTCAQFDECLLDSLGLAGEGLVECSLQDNKLLLKGPPENDSASACNARPPLYKIMHPPFCPIQHLDKKGRDDLPAEIKTRGVDVGVAVLLESSDHRLLLTHRAGHMRTFPGIWVPPGGHVEDGESLVDAVLRELNEETGLEVTEEEKKSSHILGLWESVYPPVLAMGEPKRHHVVVYLHITVSRPSQQLNKEFKLCPEEVDAAAWLSVDLIKHSVWSKDQLEKAGLEDNNDHIPITLVNQEGEHLEADLDPSILTKQQEPNALTIDRISTGSRYALSLWLTQHLEGSGEEASQEWLYGKYMKANNTKVSESKF